MGWAYGGTYTRTGSSTGIEEDDRMISSSPDQLGPRQPVLEERVGGWVWMRVGGFVVVVVSWMGWKRVCDKQINMNNILVTDSTGKPVKE